MTSARVPRSGPRNRGGTTWPLSLAGAPLLLADALWWAFDANPARGSALVVLGLAIVVAGLVMPGPSHGAARLVAFAALALAVWGCYETWQAIEAIVAQGSSGPLPGVALP
jgi:hypothetical protein